MKETTANKNAIVILETGTNEKEKLMIP